MRLRRFPGFPAILLCAAGFAAMSTKAFAASSKCCVSTTQAKIEASDALRALQRSVDSGGRCRRARCDCDGSGSVTVTDAMRLLEVAVGRNSKSCPATPTTTTTLPSSCGNDNVEAGEDCEPPHSFCRGGCNPYTNICVDLLCSDTCTCPPARCGDDIIDDGESCDPPGSPCATGTCDANCACGP